MRTSRGIPVATVLLHALLVASSRGEAQESATLFIPVVLSTAGQSGAFFTSELVETNTGDLDTTVTYVYTASQGGGSGSATNPAPLLARRQRVIPDAIAYLKSLGLAIPDGVNAVGTLRARFNSVSYVSSAAVTVRTTTPVPVSAPTGRAGLAYSALQPVGLIDGTAFLAGLRQSSQDRTNVAVQNAGTPTDGAVTLRLTWIPTGGPPAATKDVTLDPGGWAQMSLVSFDPGASTGTIQVARISGTALYYTYAVVNDQVNSDASFIAPTILRADYSSITALVLPTAVETPVFQTEVVLTNLTSGPVSATLTYTSGAFTGALNVSLTAYEQRTFPNFVQALRDEGVPGIPASGGAITGAITLKSASSIGSFALGGRTLNEGGGGRYGVFTLAQPYKTGFGTHTFLYGLQQNDENRTNVAFVNMGDLSTNPITMKFQIYDGETGLKVATVTDSVSVPPGGFRQINAFLSQLVPGVRQGWALVTYGSGFNNAIVYAVVNDGAVSGQRSGDGAVIPMDPNAIANWKGTWNNTTFGSSGQALHTELIDRVTQRLQMTLTLTGNVFGAASPGTQTFLGVNNNFAPVTFSGTSPTFGDYSATIPLGIGPLSGSATNIPSPNVSALSFNGSITGSIQTTTLNANYQITLRPSGTAQGTVTMQPPFLFQLFP